MRAAASSSAMGGPNSATERAAVGEERLHSGPGGPAERGVRKQDLPQPRSGAAAPPAFNCLAAFVATARRMLAVGARLTPPGSDGARERAEALRTVLDGQSGLRAASARGRVSVLRRATGAAAAAVTRLRCSLKQTHSRPSAALRRRRRSAVAARKRPRPGLGGTRRACRQASGARVPPAPAEAPVAPLDSRICAPPLASYQCDLGTRRT
jgi:hypothetical protein